jgi:hypothetical protein
MESQVLLGSAAHLLHASCVTDALRYLVPAYVHAQHAADGGQ